MKWWNGGMMEAGGRKYIRAEGKMAGGSRTRLIGGMMEAGGREKEVGPDGGKEEEAEGKMACGSRDR
jgi:hypothetical protein